MPHMLLQELGLSPNEAKIYTALISYGASGVSSISLRSGVHRRNAYDALQRLLHKGLVTEVYGRNETIYEPVNPDKLMELIRDKELQLEEHLPALRDKFHRVKEPERAFIYKGVEGIKNYMRDALKVGEDMYRIGDEAAWLDPRAESYTHWFLREARKKKMKLNVIFDHDALKHPDWKTLADRYKIITAKYDTNSTMDIFGDFVVTYTGTGPGELLEDSTIFVMKSAQLAESYRQWWKLLWDHLPEPEAKQKKRKPRKK